MPLRSRRIFPTGLTGDVTPEIAEDDWERGRSFPSPQNFGCRLGAMDILGLEDGAAYRINNTRLI